MVTIVQATMAVPASACTQPASRGGPSVTGVPAALPAATRHALMARILAATRSGGSPVRSRSCLASCPGRSSLRLLT